MKSPWVAFSLRPVFALIVLGAIGYLGWVFFYDRESGGITATVRAEKAGSSPAPHPPISPPAVASRPLAPPGVYYATERVAVQTSTGVKALHPGEEVRLMYRYRNGSMLVTNGRDEFVVKPSALTKDRPPVILRP